jgi:hypothetical protein
VSRRHCARSPKDRLRHTETLPKALLSKSSESHLGLYIQGDKNFTLHFIRVQKHTKNILKVTITYHDNLEFTITDDVFENAALNNSMVCQLLLGDRRGTLRILHVNFCVVTMRCADRL